MDKPWCSSKGIYLEKLNRSEEAIVVYDEVVERFIGVVQGFDMQTTMTRPRDQNMA
jgi:hypothetical protein